MQVGAQYLVIAAQRAVGTTHVKVDGGTGKRSALGDTGMDLVTAGDSMSDGKSATYLTQLFFCFQDGFYIQQAQSEVMPGMET